MTSDEMTTGSVASTSAERRILASRTRWWNSTGGGSSVKTVVAGKGNVKAGDGGAKFRSEWPELDLENWDWMKKSKVDQATGNRIDDNGASCGPQLGLAAGTSGHQTQAVVDAVVQQRDAGRGWIYRNKLMVAGAVIFMYVLVARLINGEGSLA